MAKLSVPGLLSTLGAWYTGKREGELQRRQETMAQEQQTQRLALSLLPQFAQQFEQDRNRGRDDLMGLLQVPGLAPETQQQIASQLFSTPQNNAPNPYGVGAQQQLLRQMPGGQRLPQFPVPSGGGQVAPAGPGASITPKFRDPRQEQALQGIGKNLDFYRTQAAASGDRTTLDQIEALEGDLPNLTPQVATGRLRQIVSTIGAKGTPKATTDSIGRALKAIEIKQPRLSPEDRAKADAFTGELAGIDPSTPDGVAKAAEVLARFNTEFPKWKTGKTQQELQAEETARYTSDYRKDQSVSRVRDDNRQLVTDIQDALKRGNRQEILELIDQQHALANSEEGKGAKLRPFDARRFGVTPQAVERTVEGQVPNLKAIGPGGIPVYGTRTVTGKEQGEETPGEIEARRLESAAEYAEKPEDKSKLKGQAYQTLLRSVMGEGFSDLPDATRQEILRGVNRLGEELGLGALPADIQRRMKPRDKEFLENNAFNRRMATRRQDETERRNKELHTEEGRRQTRLEVIKAKSGGLSAVNNKRYGILEDRSKTYLKQIEDFDKKAAEYRAAGDPTTAVYYEGEAKKRNELYEKTVQQMDKVLETAEVGVPGVSVKPSGAAGTPKATDTRTFTIRGRPVKATWAQMLAEAQRAGKSPASALEKWNSGR